MKDFHFIDCFEIKELLGEKANDESRLVSLIKKVPLDSIYYHMHSYFLRHYYIIAPYPNDFANWAAIQVRDRVLGEKLGSVTPSRTKSIEDLRTEIVDIINKHLSSIKINPRVVYGQPFYFMNSRIIEIPTGIRANNLKEFSECLKIIDASAIYNHIFEARLRDKRGISDFAEWFRQTLGMRELADKIENIDCYMYSLEELRTTLLGLCELELKGKSSLTKLLYGHYVGDYIAYYLALMSKQDPFEIKMINQFRENLQ